MRLNLHESNAYQVQSHRRNLIENAFAASSQHDYRMPRPSTQTEQLSLDDIPPLYDLHSQNIILQTTRIVPVNQLIRLNSAKKHHSVQMSTQKATLSHLDLEFTKQLAPRSGKIQCTMSRTLSRDSKKRSNQSWLCCDRQQQLQKYETRQIWCRGDRKPRCTSSIKPLNLRRRGV